MYVIINGVNSDTIRGLQILSLPPITKPKMRTSVATIDGRPGDIVTYLGYEAYNKTIKILLHDTYDLPAIMAFFNQSGTIIFSNDPDKVYTFETIDQINYERAVKFKTASATIHVQPYKISATEEPATGEVSTLVDKTPYIIRRTPFGTRQKGTIVGGSIVWNQIIENGDFASGYSKWAANAGSVSFDGTKCTFTVTTAEYGNALRQTKTTIEGHVYLGAMTVTPSKATRVGMYIGERVVGLVDIPASRTAFSVVHKAEETGKNVYYYCNRRMQLENGDSCVYENMQLFDLTLMFGPTIADYIYTQEQATAGAGVALAKAWAEITADYYPYDAGSIKSVTGLTSHKMTGFNQWDEEWEVGGLNASGSATAQTDRIRSKNHIPVIADATYYFKGSVYIWAYDADKVFINRLSYNGIGGTAGVADRTVLIPSGVAYIKFVSYTSYGTTYNNDICVNLSDPSKNGTYEPYTEAVYSLSSIDLRGIPMIEDGALKYDGDVYKADGTVTRNYGIVDLGTLNWKRSAISTGSSAYMFYSGLSTAKMTANNNEVANIVCVLYTASSRNNLANADKVVAITDNGFVTIRDDSYTDATAFKTAMSGVYLVYELAEPTIEQAEPYTALQICDPNGTEEWVGASMPVGHDTTYIDPISMTVTNEGNTESAPSITIEGEGMVEVTVDGLNILQIQMPASGEITIDSRTLDATDGEGGLANRSVTGDYNDLRLAPGEHTVTVTGDVTSVTLKNTSRWI